MQRFDVLVTIITLPLQNIKLVYKITNKILKHLKYFSL